MSHMPEKPLTSWAFISKFLLIYMALSPLSHIKSPAEYGGLILRPTEIFIHISLYKLQWKQLCQKEPTAFCCSNLPNSVMLKILTHMELVWLGSFLLPCLTEMGDPTTHGLHSISKLLLFLTILAASSNIIEVPEVAGHGFGISVLNSLLPYRFSFVP